MRLADLRDKIQRIDVNGISTRYYDDGRAGDPILLIHGGHFGFLVPLGVESWGGVLLDLGAYGRVIAYDKLGQGETGLPRTDADWSVEGVVDHAAAFIEALNLRNLTLIGHSRGGLTALVLAFRMPERIKNLVVVSSATVAPAILDKPDMDFYDNVERTAPADPAGLIRHYQAAQAVAEGELPADYVELAVRMLHSDLHKGAVAGYARNAQAHWIPSLARARDDMHRKLNTVGIPVPTLLVWGLNDRSAPIPLGHALFQMVAHATKNSSMCILANAGHQVFRDRRETFGKMVGAFIRG